MSAETIKAASPGDVAEIMGLIRSVSESMSDDGIDQWDDIYPDSDTIEQDISQGALFAYFSDGKIAAIMVLNESFDPSYDTVDWSPRIKRPRFVHRLCVSPMFRKKGIAKTLMEYAEKEAIGNGFDSIRLDAYSKNPAAVKLYQNLGYRMAGEVDLRKGRFFCFEKVIRREEAPGDTRLERILKERFGKAPQFGSLMDNIVDGLFNDPNKDPEENGKQAD